MIIEGKSPFNNDLVCLLQQDLRKTLVSSYLIVWSEEGWSISRRNDPRPTEVRDIGEEHKHMINIQLARSLTIYYG